MTAWNAVRSSFEREVAVYARSRLEDVLLRGLAPYPITGSRGWVAAPRARRPGLRATSPAMSSAEAGAADWNFGDLLDATAAVVDPTRPAIIRGDRVTSWAAFDARTNSLAKAMLAHGLAHGDRVAILARNIPEYIEIAAASFKARLTHVNVNYRYTAPEIAYILEDSGARAMFYQEEFAETVAPLSGGLAFALPVDGALSRYDAMTDGDASPLGIRRSRDDGYLLYTGGTTGRPRGLMWRSGDARAVQLESPTNMFSIRTMDDHVRVARDNVSPGRVLPACPLMHGAGLNSALAELVGGGSVVLLPSDRFDAAELWDAAARHRATRILIVGDAFARPMARTLTAHPGRWDLSALRVISSAGLMWSEEVKAALVAALPLVTLVDILGASEASGLGYALTTASRSTPTGIFESAAHTVIIDPDTGRVLQPDEAGEGWLARTPPFASGYHGDPQKTAETFRVIGGQRYAIPGDLGARDAAGRLRLIGRGNMCINSGGEKVFPEEVEEALKLQRGVEDAMVLGIGDPIWGKAVVALISADDGYDEATVRDGIAATLAAYKHPKHLLVVDAVPRHASGKGDYRSATLIAEKMLA